VDKYLLVVLIFLIVGIPVSFVSPTDGTIREQPFFILFYSSIGGICIVIVYSSYKERKERQKESRKRRRKSKK